MHLSIEILTFAELRRRRQHRQQQKCAMNEQQNEIAKIAHEFDEIYISQAKVTSCEKQNTKNAT